MARGAGRVARLAREVVARPRSGRCWSRSIFPSFAHTCCRQRRPHHWSCRCRRRRCTSRNPSVKTRRGRPGSHRRCRCLSRHGCNAAFAYPAEAERRPLHCDGRSAPEAGAGVAGRLATRRADVHVDGDGAADPALFVGACTASTRGPFKTIVYAVQFPLDPIHSVLPLRQA